MSLNGLDNVKVGEAYNAAVTEPGGWFLLKYSTRDEVELLSHGNGGETELRNAVAGYEESSPLYGFLKYRRRNVLIKYMPEDCSRLIQARVAVHFNAVCERFAPYDTQFDITVADDIRDSKLSAACSLHAASRSNSSSNSLRRKHLMEIAEEDEEEQQPTKRQSLIKTANDETDEQQGSKSPGEPTEPVRLDSELAALPENTKFSAASTSEVPEFVGAEEVPPADSSRRLSSQSGRDIYTSYSTFSTYSKPKVKIGPRPSLDTNPRPQTAGNFRPVSSIPAGFKLFGKGTTKKTSSPSSTSRKDSIGSVGTPDSELSDITFATTIPIPEEPGNKDNLSIMRPNTSSGVSTKSATTTMTGKQAMTPEKARLKKAMQLREKKRKMVANTAAALAVPTIETQPDDTVLDDDKTSAHTETNTPIIQADSGIVLDASPKDDQASELTQSDSRPTSPVIGSSEADQSTKASSISESTELAAQRDDLENSKSEGTANDGEPIFQEPTPTIFIEPILEKGDIGNEDVEQDPVSENTTIEGSPVSVKIVPAESVPEEAIAPKSPLAETSGSAPTTATDNDEEDELSNRDINGSTTQNKDSNTISGIPASIEPRVGQATTKDEPETTTVPVTVPASNIESSPKGGQITDISTTHVARVSPADQNEPVGTAAPSKDLVDESSPVKSSEARDDKADEADEEQESDTDTIPARPSTEQTTKRRAFNIDPIRTDLANQSRPTSQSDVNFSDSESLLDELQSATVQQAKPMSVSKTPVTPVFPGRSPAMASPVRGPNATGKPLMVRTVSNPVRGSFIAPPSDVSQSSARSVSQGGAYLQKITQQRTGDNGAGKKFNAGSSISQRIKALEMLSVTSADATPPQPGSRPSSTFFTVKKDRAPSRSPSLVDRTNSLSRDSRPLTAQSRGDSPETSRFNRDRSGSISSRLSVFEPADAPSYQPRGRPETISVTARIIRSSPSTSRNTTERSPLELKQSPLVVDHQRADETVSKSQERQTSHTREPSKDSMSRRSSFSVVKDFIKERRKSISSPSTDNLAAPSGSEARSPSNSASAYQNNSFSSRLSIGSRRSLSRDRGSISPSIVTEGSGSGDETKSNSDKKKSRTSRLMRRLSSLSGSSRNKISSPPIGTPTVTEEEWPEPTAPAVFNASSSTVEVDMGDVNVQFPDTLLWKRRNMYLDSQGFVVLSAAAQQQTAKTLGVKRYHLSEFKAPYAPDVEVQELPNSVVLDLLEGSAVQVACVDRTGQMKVLQILRDAHSIHVAR